MGRCIYCGQSAGIFQKSHQTCKDQHDYALARIPAFLPKFLESDLPAERFCQLLQEGAQASFIAPSDLSAAVTRGMLNALASTCEDRILNEPELGRFFGVADALAPVLTGNNEVSEKLVKLDVLLQLAQKRVPDLVEVGDDLPIDLRPDETVVWIFNNVTLYREKNGSELSAERPGLLVALHEDNYVRPSALTKMPRSTFREEARGDLVTTSQNLFFVQGVDQITKLSFRRISSLYAFSDHLEITSSAGKRRIFALDDPWFAANLLAGLFRVIRS